MTDKDNEAFCKSCYGRLYGPKGYGFGNTLSTEDSVSSTRKVEVKDEASYKPQIASNANKLGSTSSLNKSGSSNSLSKFGGTNTCPTCEKAVYFAEQVIQFNV